MLKSMPKDGMRLYDLGDRLEKAIDLKDVGQFRVVLAKISSECGDDKQKLSNLVGPSLAKAAKMTPDEENIPANFVSGLLSHGVDCNASWYSNTPLILAAERGNTEVVQLLLQAGCDVDRCDTETRTALHWASMGGHVDTVQALLTAGADPNRHDRLYSFTPLMLAARQGEEQVVRVLLRTGRVQVDATDMYGETALQDSVRNNQLSSMGLLLQYNVDVNHCDELGGTALLTAVSYKRHKAVLLLILYNCDINFLGTCRRVGFSMGQNTSSRNTSQQNDSPKDALEVAILEGYWTAAKILCDYGANANAKFRYLQHHRLMVELQQSLWVIPQWLVEEISNPKSLKESVRNVIRRCLPSGLMVFAAVEKLSLPPMLKEYVGVKELEDKNVVKKLSKELKYEVAAKKHEDDDEYDDDDDDGVRISLLSL